MLAIVKMRFLSLRNLRLKDLKKLKIFNRKEATCNNKNNNSNNSNSRWIRIMKKGIGRFLLTILYRRECISFLGQKLLWLLFLLKIKKFKQIQTLIKNKKH